MTFVFAEEAGRKGRGFDFSGSASGCREGRNEVWAEKPAVTCDFWVLGREKGRDL